ncbi:hypothetical protein GCM10008965_26170 [Methylorubrum aminovorans]|nr:hypothetical protein GCM10025880_04340 [Methylorubrum aminovorans]
MAHRGRLKQRRVEPVIPSRKDQPRQPNFDKAAYRERNKVERRINRSSSIAASPPATRSAPPTTSL